MTELLGCSSCNMTFKSSLLLGKHQEKFCIGGDIGKARETRTPQDMIERVKDYKKRRAEHRLQRNMEERELLNQYEAQETSEPVQNTKASTGHVDPSPRVQWIREHEAKMKYLADSHGKHVAGIVTENRELEKQRKEIELRLKELNAHNKNASQVEKMLQELKAQEQKNEHLLESMREQMQILQKESMRNKNHSRHSDSQLHSLMEKEKVPLFQPQTYIPFYGGGILSSEISALRLSYLQNGGNDHMILAQLQALLHEALQVEQREKQPRTHRHKEKSKRGHDSIRHSLNRELFALEIENRRLEDEIMTFQMKKRKDPTFSKTSHNSRPSHFPQSVKANRDQKLKTMKKDIDLLKQEIEIHRLGRRMKTSTTQVPPDQAALSPLPPLEDMRAQTPTLAKHFLESTDGLGPAPYDPIAGFVVFYDFLLGLDPCYRVCRLVVGLYSGPEEMGTPSSLPPVYCEAGNLSPYFSDSKRGNLATLATKQAVPRVRPSPSIALVLELQASGGYDPYGQEVNRLISRGWVKIDIFDSHNRVISGRWKVPIRILPVNPRLTTGEINAVPQLENAELYLRIVNARDADVQSFAPITHNNAGLYKYPPQTPARSLFAADAPLPSYPSPYRFPNSQMMWPSYLETVDPHPPSSMLFEEFE
ncbi:coiled-coil domain-containing protein 17-like [Acipenser oxyrinchus oxyrinchus]|uniref:Coiled-coil domain-containing protein 17-like n=1 Tax=Acipenser oxyrinchus oxyrinchus TaxID=40147 RepID=A0AAD8GL65_ACIOX|nr:coiled-coil domain-containing protein 17-like [Acipenser oxyrinchus oxyrinchus]